MGSFGKILVIGGDEESPAAMGDLLRDEGFEVNQNCSPQEVQEKFNLMRPDLVIINAEGVSIATSDDEKTNEVVSLCTWIRSRTHVPMIVTHIAGFEMVSAHEAGADLVLKVPIGPSEFVARVRALLRRTPPRSCNGDLILSFGGLKLDRGSRILFLEGGKIQLGDQSFVLVEELMLNREKVTRYKVLKTLLSIGDSDLDSCTRRVRKRMEEIEGWRRLVSVRGLGLRLLEDRPVVGTSAASAQYASGAYEETY